MPNMYTAKRPGCHGPSKGIAQGSRGPSRSGRKRARAAQLTFSQGAANLWAAGSRRPRALTIGGAANRMGSPGALACEAGGIFERDEP